ncbi:type III secretion system chaperone family protein [Gephyromycinifex aptenodytis]|uniref:YbjN domain-containing protein n=1 Tax=Gephyromycinifex aptenodytis TaxID=2716227 RepID=UPI001444F11C|nr:YbjN domain-containing protein [Gephyromycinifex aptenodytis]
MNREQQAAIEAITAFAAEQDLPMEEGARAGEYIISLPGENKLRTPCSFLVGERAMSVSAFVIRRPDENAVEVYRFLLRRNMRTPGLAYSIDESGDVYVTGRVPLKAVDAEYLDHLFGVLLQSTDGAFNELLLLGFLQSMKREWQWRVSRRESLRNLEPFRDVLGRDASEEILPYFEDEEFVHLDAGEDISAIADEPIAQESDIATEGGGPMGEAFVEDNADCAQSGRLPTASEIAKGWNGGDTADASGS